MQQKFSINQHFSDKVRDGIYVANFEYADIQIEVYAKNEPTQMQYGYRHMVIEYRILEIAGEDFRSRIIGLKEKGVKTEPAFGLLLGLDNPYTDLIELEKLSDDELYAFVKEKIATY